MSNPIADELAAIVRSRDARIADLEQRLVTSTTRERELAQECEQLRVQLAGCAVAAHGGTSEPVVAKHGDYGWSPAYQDTLDLRRKHDALERQLAEAQAQLTAAIRDLDESKDAALLKQTRDAHRIQARLAETHRRQLEEARAAFVIASKTDSAAILKLLHERDAALAQVGELERAADAAVLTAHRVCIGLEHDPQNGKLHGYCIVCGVPWPCAYASPKAELVEQITTLTRDLAQARERVAELEQERSPLYRTVERARLRPVWELVERVLDEIQSNILNCDELAEALAAVRKELGR